MRRGSTWILTIIVAVSLLAPPAHAKQGNRTSGEVRSGHRVSLRTFRSKPAVAIIPSTRVYYVRDESDFDLYQYGEHWYLVDNGTWYRARSWRGPFLSFSRARVPRQILNIPGAYRRSWVGRSEASSSARGSTRIAVEEPYPGSLPYFVGEPRMAIIPDTRVHYLLEESDHDLYRLGESWYMVRNDRWYKASSWRGSFRPIRVNQVPREIRTIPSGFRRNWVAPGTPVTHDLEQY